MGDPMGLQRMEALVEQEGRGEILAGWIAAAGGHHVDFSCHQQVRVCRCGFANHIPNQHGRQHGVVQFAGQTKAQRGAEAAMVEDGGVEIAAEDGFLLSFALCLLAHQGPKVAGALDALQQWLTAAADDFAEPILHVVAGVWLMLGLIAIRCATELAHRGQIVHVKAYPGDFEPGRVGVLRVSVNRVLLRYEFSIFYRRIGGAPPGREHR